MATESQLASIRRAIERRRGARGAQATPEVQPGPAQSRLGVEPLADEPQSSVPGVDRSAEEAAVRALASFVERNRGEDGAKSIHAPTVA